MEINSLCDRVLIDLEVDNEPVELSEQQVSMFRGEKGEKGDKGDPSVTSVRETGDGNAYTSSEYVEGTNEIVFTKGKTFQEQITQDNKLDYSLIDNAPTKTSDLTNDGDGTSNFATEAYVAENGGKIDSISVNNVPQTIDQNKNVDITVPTVYNGTLTIQKNGTTIATFTANSNENVTANILADTQLQADWSQSNTDAADYIKNKPTKVSDFNNDSGFITNTVNSLTNYYLKSETYTQAEVNALIGAIKTIKAEIVAELPTASADTYFNTSKTIYMVANSSQSGNNYYDEYITIRSGTEGSYTYSWENIGSTQIDLSNYVQKTFTIAGVDLQDNITKAEMLSALNVEDGAQVNTIESISANGSTITPDANGDVALPISHGENNLGLVQTNWNYYSGLFISNNGTIQVSSASDTDISNRYSNKPIVPTKLNFAVKSALTDSNHLTMNETEKETAQEVLGVNAITGSGAPTNSTAGIVGQNYIDTTGKNVYECISKTAQGTDPETYSYEWKLLNVRVSGLPTGLAYNYALNELMLSDASNAGIDNRVSAYGTGYGAITPKNLDYAASTTYLKGNSAPTTSTVGFVGQLYINSADNVTYQCTAITTESDVTTYTWTQLIRVTNLAENGGDDGGTAGVVKLQGTHYAGIIVNPTTKNMSIADTIDSDTFWNNRKSYGFAVKASNLDKYLKLALGSTSAEADNTTTWTETNKENARNKLGLNFGIARLG